MEVYDGSIGLKFGKKKKRRKVRRKGEGGVPWILTGPDTGSSRCAMFH